MNFREDILNLRDTGVDQSEYIAVIKGMNEHSPFSRFMDKYSFPYPMASFLRSFIVGGKIDPLLIHSGMFFVSEADESATGYNKHREGYLLYTKSRMSRGDDTPRPELKLVIPYGVKLNEVKEFLDENWGSFVQPRMRLYKSRGSAPNRRIRSRGLAAIEARIIELKSQYKTSAQIAVTINKEFGRSYTYNNINQIVYRMNNR